MVGASGSDAGAISGSGNQRLPTLTDLLYQLATRAVTSEELVRRSLRAIDVSQPTLNAFRVVLTESALADAAAADKRRAAGDTAPLLGIPIAVKDDVDVAGVPTAFGTQGYVAPATDDCEVVRRLKAAGAVIVGKTNTCELGQWPFTSGPGFGHTRNPWSRRHTPGGSSGGSAAAVAAGLVTAAIGSDGAGSIRIPAAWTHLVGIKPQRGRISTWPLPEAFNGVTVNGVLARTVEDAALVLDAASGNVEGDRHQPPPVTVSDFVGIAPGPLKIALSTHFPYTGFRAKLHPEILAATQRVGDQLELLGHTVVKGNPDYGLRLSWNFLARSTAGLWEWAEEYAFWRPRVRGPTPTTTKLAKTMMPAARYNPHTMLKWYRMKTTSSAVAVISQLVRSNTTRLTYRGRSAITLRSDPAPGRWSRTSSSTRAGDTVLMAASIAANNPPKPINTIEPSSW